MHNEFGQANVLRTPHLSSSIFESEQRETGRCKASTHVCRALASNVEGTVSRTHVTNPYQKNIDQSPDAQASEAEQFTQTFSPLTQIETVSPKASKCDATQKQSRNQRLRVYQGTNGCCSVSGLSPER